MTLVFRPNDLVRIEEAIYDSSGNRLLVPVGKKGLVTEHYMDGLFYVFIEDDPIQRLLRYYVFSRIGAVRTPEEKHLWLKEHHCLAHFTRESLKQDALSSHYQAHFEAKSRPRNFP